MKQLIDVFLLENLQILESQSPNGAMRISGIFQRADTPNNNSRIYPKAILERELGNLKTKLAGRCLLGELDHPSDRSTVNLKEASHIITNLKMVGDEMIGEAEILDTPAGQVAKALIRNKVKVGISSRGLGTVTEMSEGIKVVNEDFRLLTFDLVADPSTHEAYPKVSESLTESKKIDSIIKDTLDKTKREKTFVRLLKEAMEEHKEEEAIEEIFGSLARKLSTKLSSYADKADKKAKQVQKRKEYQAKYKKAQKDTKSARQTLKQEYSPNKKKRDGIVFKGKDKSSTGERRSGNSSKADDARKTRMQAARERLRLKGYNSRPLKGAALKAKKTPARSRRLDLASVMVNHYKALSEGSRGIQKLHRATTSLKKKLLRKGEDPVGNSNFMGLVKSRNQKSGNINSRKWERYERNKKSK